MNYPCPQCDGTLRDTGERHNTRPVWRCDSCDFSDLGLPTDVSAYVGEDGPPRELTDEQMQAFVDIACDPAPWADKPRECYWDSEKFGRIQLAPAPEPRPSTPQEDASLRAWLSEHTTGVGRLIDATGADDEVSAPQTPEQRARAIKWLKARVVPLMPDDGRWFLVGKTVDDDD